MPMQIEDLKDKHIINVVVTGNPKHEGTEEIFLNYGTYINEIIPHEYSLLIDCTNMGVFVLKSVPILENLLRLFMGTGFKRIVFINSKSKVSNIQLARAANSVDGFKGIFVDTVEEAMNICS